MTLCTMLYNMIAAGAILSRALIFYLFEFQTLILATLFLAMPFQIKLSVASFKFLSNTVREHLFLETACSSIGVARGAKGAMPSP